MGRTLWEKLNNISAVILAVVGLLLAPDQLRDWLELDWAGRTFTWLILLILGFAAFLHLIPSRVQRRFGLSRYRCRAIIPRKIEHVTLDAQNNATTECEKALVFLSEPEGEDLVDFIETTSGLDLDEGTYSSPDSTVADVRRRSTGVLAVFWAPKEAISPFSEYVHRSRIVAPGVPGRQAFFHGAHVDREIGVLDCTISSERAIESAVAIRWSSPLRPTRLRIYERALANAKRGTPQPVVQSDRRTLTWRVDRPKFKATYACCVFFSGGKEMIRAEIEASSPRGSLKRWGRKLWR